MGSVGALGMPREVKLHEVSEHYVRALAPHNFYRQMTGEVQVLPLGAIRVDAMQVREDVPLKRSDIGGLPILVLKAIEQPGTRDLRHEPVHALFVRRHRPLHRRCGEAGVPSGSENRRHLDRPRVPEPLSTCTSMRLELLVIKNTATRRWAPSDLRNMIGVGNRRINPLYFGDGGILKNASKPRQTPCKGQIVR